MTEKIIIQGAREHNLKSIDLEIPKNELVVFTGVSGSGKSSLAMDTIYAEGQRRYVESLSAYARQFLGVMKKPDVDSIEGLSPAIAIDQKSASHNPRSTVGTVTEVYDFLRLLYARVGHPHCPECKREISRQSTQQIVEQILKIVSRESDFKTERGVRLMILSPIVRDRKGEYTALFANLKKQGIVRARIDGEIKSLNEDFQLIKTNKHTIEALLNRLSINHKKLKNAKSLESILTQSVEISLKLSGGNVIASIVRDKDFDFTEDPRDFEDHLFSENFACPYCNVSIPELEPRSFSFNSPHGACPVCDGLGTQLKIDEQLLTNPNLSVREGGIYPWTSLFERNTWTSRIIRAVAEDLDFSLDLPIKDMARKSFEILLYGTGDKRYKVHYEGSYGGGGIFYSRFEGVIPNLMRRYRETKSDYIRREIEKYMVIERCPECLGTRLRKEALSVVIAEKSVSEVANFSIRKLWEWCGSLDKKFSQREREISKQIMKEIRYRLKFLLDVGLEYLTMSRASAQLSGGEAQRIRLASQIGTGLSGVLYVLDEPSIGLHQKDQGKLIETLKQLKALGNTVIVVEHDMDTILASDYVVDFGPGAGEHGGKVVAVGSPREISANKNSLTGLYLSGARKVGAGLNEELENDKEEVAKKMDGKNVVLKKAYGRNLKNIDFEVPLGKFVCVTGVSGSGKSSLVMDTFYTALRQYFGLKIIKLPEPYGGLAGVENINRVIAIDQSPIGRTPRSNPATYTKTFDGIRDLFSKTEEARVRGYKPGRFSFNVKGGRCEACQGDGQIKIEMQFMPDVYVDCEVCQGKRYNREALEIHYKEKNISEVLDMAVEEALKFFENIPTIRRKLETIQDVGLGYIRLGQPAPTLSGGEAQRVKLASELAKMAKGHTLYILDEPTTGLHFADLERLIKIIRRLTAKGNTVLVVEHNLDVIINADWVIDLGPDGGDGGGQIVFAGPVDELQRHKLSYTGQALRSRR